MVAFTNLVTLIILLVSNTAAAKEITDTADIEIDMEYSNQRRQLLWGSGGFSWFLCKLKLIFISICQMADFFST
jgi:hypothetical protein